MNQQCNKPWPRFLTCRLLTCSCLAVALCLMPLPCVGQSPAASTDQEATKQTLNQMLHDYVARFNSRDFDALAKLLRNDVAYHDDSTDVSGSAAFVEGLRKVTSEEPSLKLSIEIQEVKLDGDAVAFAAGTASMASDNTPSESSRFEVEFGKEADAWKVVSISETSGASASANALESLTWLIGSWQDSHDPTLQTTVRFVSGNQFLQRTVERRTDTETTQIATEMIGYDPQSHRVRSWLFFADGSFGSGTWQGESDHCKIHLRQTLVDGSTATGTYVVRPTSADSMTIQLISRVVNGELQPTGQPTSLTRIPATTHSTTSDLKDNP